MSEENLARYDELLVDAYHLDELRGCLAKAVRFTVQHSFPTAGEFRVDESGQSTRGVYWRSPDLRCGPSFGTNSPMHRSWGYIQ